MTHKMTKEEFDGASSEPCLREITVFPHEMKQIIESTSDIKEAIHSFKEKFPAESQKNLRFHFAIQEFQVALEKLIKSLEGSFLTDRFVEKVKSKQQLIPAMSIDSCLSK
jgi:hypothetical protein